MDKKDIYEHLANIYLDASSKRKKKDTHLLKLTKPVFVISLFLVFGISSIIFNNVHRNKPLNSETALFISTETAKINFNFNPAKKEVYSINLNKLDMHKFNAVGFSLKTKDYADTIALRVEFTNSFKEKSEIYIKNVSHKWHDYKINLSEFKKVTDWSKMSNLSFTVEEWNAKEDYGIVYIDNIRFLK